MSASHFTPTNRSFLLAAGLSAATLAIHVGMGTREIISPVLDSGLPAVVRYVSLVCWHMVTLMLLAFTATYAYSTRLTAHSLTLGVTALSAGFAALFAIVAIGSGVGFDEMPQAVAFLAIAAAGGRGLLYPPARQQTVAFRPLAPSHRAPH